MFRYVWLSTLSTARRIVRARSLLKQMTETRGSPSSRSVSGAEVACAMLLYVSIRAVISDGSFCSGATRGIGENLSADCISKQVSTRNFQVERDESPATGRFPPPQA